MTKGLDNLSAAVPVFNPEPGLLGLCAALAREFSPVVVVDDGSREDIGEFEKLPEGVVVLRHGENRGKGRAIKTAIEYLRKNHPEVAGVVFADGDGQHRPSDVKDVAARMRTTDRVAIGVRDFRRAGIPLRSRFGNVLTSLLTRAFLGMKVSDTQTGLRAIPARLFKMMCEIPGERFEYEMRLFGVLSDKGEGLEQVPIETIYLESNRASHFRPIRDSVRIYRGLFGMALTRFVKFTASSVGGFLLDNAVFTAMLFGMESLELPRRWEILISLVIARAVSATANFVCNRKFVFSGTSGAVSAFSRYWMLVLAIALMSYFGTAAASAALGAHGWLITGIKVVVETVLFVLSYKVQKKWVFA